MRLTTPLLIAVVLALLAGCGDSSETTSAPAPDAPTPGRPDDAVTQKLRSAWERDPSCRRPEGASRWGCSVGDYRCQAVVTGKGWSVSCAKPGRSTGFRVPPS